MPELTLSCAILCAMAALCGGFIDAISGGGGLLTIPALLLGGIPPHLALGTNKLSAFLGTAVSLGRFAASGLVNWRLAAGGAGFSIAGSWLGSFAATSLPAEMLAKAIIGMLPVAMIATLMPQKKNPAEILNVTGWRFWLLLPAFCLALGFYDGFFGPGTGSFLILGLHWLLKQDLIHASATAKTFNLASNVSSAIYFMWHGLIFWKLGLIMAACFMLGNWLGATFAIHVGGKAVRRFLLLSLFLLLLSLVWRFFISPA